MHCSTCDHETNCSDNICITEESMEKGYCANYKNAMANKLAASLERLKDADKTIRLASKQVSEYDTIALAAYLERWPEPMKE